MGERRYTIGDVSKITGVSKDTLRFYDKIGLLKPGYVNPLNNYRYYTYDQFWRIDIIICCRKLDIPIPKIKEILASNDNEKVVELMKEQQEEALHLSEYFKRVAEDIEWYSAQHQQIRDAATSSEVIVKSLPERRVIFGVNQYDAKAYHVKLKEICYSVLGTHDSFRRNYGFILNPEELKHNVVQKKGEYVEFLDKRNMERVEGNKEHLLTIPAGDYACCVVNVVDNKADFSVLNKWIAKNKVTPELVVADEIGLQLFEYFGTEWPCEVKIKLK